jgi:hypothetical protein
MGKAKAHKPKDPRPNGEIVHDIEEDDEVETEVGSPDDVLIPHEVVHGLEMAFADRAVVVLTLDRASGQVSVDESLSTPMETWAIIGRALESASEVAALPLYDDDH